jgi:YbbR domain-containing protein
VNIFKFLLHLVRNNIVLKIVAVVLAVILWSYVMSDTNITRTKTLENVPVKIDNTLELKNKGLTISEDLSKIASSVSVQLSVAQKDLKQVNTGNVTASIDLSKINGKGETELKLSGTTKYGTIVGFNPASIKVTVDDYVKKTVPVECVKTGVANPAYYVGEPQISPNVLEIAGARMDVEKVASALCTVDQSSLTDSVNRSFNVTLLDANRQELAASAYFENLPSVIVKIEVLPRKTVAINAIASLTNTSKLKEGYEITGVTADPTEIQIAGREGALKNINEVFLENIDVSGASENMLVSARPKSIDGIHFLNGSDIKVQISIAQKQVKKSIQNVRLSYINKTSGLKAALDPTGIDVVLEGGAADVDTLYGYDLIAYVDLKGLGKGIYMLPVMVEKTDSNLKATPSVDKVKVTLK